MYLITGVTGHLGNAAAEAFLQQEGASKLTVLSRNHEKAKSWAERGVEVKIGDYNDYKSLVNAFKGVEKLLFVSSSDLENRASHHQNVIAAAKAAKVNHVIFTSFQYQSTAGDSPNGLMPVYKTTEDLLIASGLTYTILRNGIYMDMLPDIIGPAIREGKVLFAPAGDTPVAFTSRNDLAQAAANVLVNDGFENRIIDLVNGQRVCFQEIADQLGDVLKLKIMYLNVSDTEYQQALLDAGLPPIVVGLFVGILKSIKAGEFDKTGMDLEAILGRTPLQVKNFLEAYYA
ncbi:MULTISPECIES: SDR family oxidoreductase [Sphingobacterium]|uniref:SDR family oxidoreductase n=1 Tax=Sphingobacterium TaxID=28453 RepID=UPI0013DA3CB7|nr:MULTISPECIES: SDR family oxidoreductase [unclassified Sphingobacterium]